MNITIRAIRQAIQEIIREELSNDSVNVRGTVAVVVLPAVKFERVELPRTNYLKLVYGGRSVLVRGIRVGGDVVFKYVQALESVINEASIQSYEYKAMVSMDISSYSNKQPYGMSSVSEPNSDVSVSGIDDLEISPEPEGELAEFITSLVQEDAYEQADKKF